MADIDRDETIKTLQQMNLRLSHLDNQMDQNFKSQHEVLQEHVGRLHMSIEAIAHSLEQLNYSVCKMKDPHDEMGEQRSIRSIGPVMKLRTGTVQSLVQMQSAVLQELVSGNKVTSRRSDADSGYGPAEIDVSRSPKSMGAAMRPVASIIPAPDEGSLPGLLRNVDPHEVKPPKTSTSHAAKLHQMNEESQTHILGSTSLCSSVEDAPKDAGTKFILRLPSVTHLALGLLLLGILSLAVACGCLHCPSDAGLRFTVLESIIYGVAAVLCIRSMKKALCSRNLGLATGRLHGFVAEFKVNWSEVSGQEGCKYVSMWLLVVLTIIVARGLGTYWRLSSSDSTNLTHEVLFCILEMLSVLVFALTSGLLMSAAYTQSHLLLGLDKSLDCWCSHIMVMPDFEEGVRSWNVLQALLKCVGRELAGSFLVLQIFGSLCFIFFLVSGIMLAFRDDFETVPLLVEIFSSVPLLFLCTLSLRVSAHGAALTEKCRAIPSFVNQIPAYDIDHNRQYLVRFIQDSSAGFCIRDVKLTQEMFMKQVYVVGALLSATFSALSRLLI